MKKMRLIAPLALAATAAAIGFAPIAAAASTDTTTSNGLSTVVDTPGDVEVTAQPGATALLGPQYPWFGYGYGMHEDRGGHR